METGNSAASTPTLMVAPGVSSGGSVNVMLNAPARSTHIRALRRATSSAATRVRCLMSVPPQATWRTSDDAPPLIGEHETSADLESARAQLTQLIGRGSASLYATVVSRRAKPSADRDHPEQTGPEEENRAGLRHFLGRRGSAIDIRLGTDPDVDVLPVHGERVHLVQTAGFFDEARRELARQRDIAVRLEFENDDTRYPRDEENIADNRVRHRTRLDQRGDRRPRCPRSLSKHRDVTSLRGAENTDRSRRPSGKDGDVSTFLGGEDTDRERKSRGKSDANASAVARLDEVDVRRP